MSRLLLVLLLAGLVGGCASSRISIDDADLPSAAELTEVPFYPQEAYQCGPAALATMLAQRGIPADPDVLVDQVYIPERRGSLQVEMVAAARAAGLLVYPLRSRLEDVLAEVAAGNPVLVLQNLAFDRWPQWHFAVVVGYDLVEQRLVLRSGTTERWIASFRDFERTWSKAERWAVVTLKPDQLPATARETVWLRSASDLEQVGQVSPARVAYEAAVARWRSSLGLFALANSQYAAGQKEMAERSLRDSIATDLGFAIGWFNLSHVLAERGCHVGAQQARSCAKRLAPDDPRFDAPLPAVTRESAASCQPVPPCGAR
ncbi:peptidase C39 family protein [Stutzerimonas stutzeri]|nr:peptidase C39 family protein [Stutzerimonas stutzeri]